MRLIFAFFLTFVTIFAQNLNFRSIKSDFTQTITSPEGSVLTYKGEFFAKKPFFALWRYDTPVKKSVYFLDKEVLVVEPELEQVIYSKIPDAPNISELINSAKEVSKNLYKATYNNREYLITLRENKPYKITYKDKLDNSVNILLSNTSTNLIIDDSTFRFKIPAGYDVLKQ